MSNWYWVGAAIVLLSLGAWMLPRLLRSLDRWLLALEEDGWIFYRRRKPETGGLGGALLELQKVIEPSTRQIVEVDRNVRPDGDQGDGDLPNSLRPRP